jgi:hypothetical protein
MPRVASITLPGPQPLESAAGYRANVGFTSQQRWVGRQSELRSLLDQKVAEGGVVDASIEHHEQGMYRLEITYSTGSATDTGGGVPNAQGVTTTWTRMRTRGEKSLWTVPAVVAALAVVTDDALRARVRSDIEAYFRREIDKDVLDSSLGQAGVNDQPALRALMASFAAGEESYAIEVFTVRRTQVGPLQYLQNDDGTINRIWTRDRLTSQANFPTVFAVRLPPGVYLQSAAELTQQDEFRWQSVQEWDHADTYSNWIYPLA